MSDIKTVLPPLPLQTLYVTHACLQRVEFYGYTADQMFAYAKAAVLAASDKDAERYLWLKENQAYVAVHPHYMDLPRHQRTGWAIRMVFGNDNSFDEAIDAALQSAGDNNALAAKKG